MRSAITTTSGLTVRACSATSSQDEPAVRTETRYRSGSVGHDIQCLRADRAGRAGDGNGGAAHLWMACGSGVIEYPGDEIRSGQDEQQCVDAVQKATVPWQKRAHVLEFEITFQHALEQIADHSDNADDRPKTAACHQEVPSPTAASSTSAATIAPTNPNSVPSQDLPGTPVVEGSLPEQRVFEGLTSEERSDVGDGGDRDSPDQELLTVIELEHERAEPGEAADPEDPEQRDRQIGQRSGVVGVDEVPETTERDRHDHDHRVRLLAAPVGGERQQGGTGEPEHGCRAVLAVTHGVEELDRTESGAAAISTAPASG